MNKKVLVVDDSSAVRQSLCFVLEQNDFDVVDAVDGVDGLSKLDGSPFQLIITDVNMPNLDGIGMIKKVREIAKYKFTPILVLTTESQGSVMEKGKEAGATGWIVKPFSADKLLGAIKKVCG